MPCDILGDLLACDVLEGLCRIFTTADRAIGKDVLRQSDTAMERVCSGNLLSKALHEVLECMECAQLPLHPGKDDLTSCCQGPTAITLNQGRTTIEGSKPSEKERPTHRIKGGIQGHEQGKATDAIDLRITAGNVIRYGGMVVNGKISPAVHPIRHFFREVFGKNTTGKRNVIEQCPFYEVHDPNLSDNIRYS